MGKEVAFVVSPRAASTAFDDPESAPPGGPRVSADPRFSWATFGIAYAVFITALVVGVLLYGLYRWQMVVDTGPRTRRYSVAMMILTLLYLISTVLENEVLGTLASNLPYEAFPHALVLLGFHWWAYRDGQPATATFALCFATATLAAGAAFFALGWIAVRAGQWAGGGGAAILALYTFVKCSATKRSFVDASYFTETLSDIPAARRPFFSIRLTPLHHGMALVVATLAAAVGMELLQGNPASELMALELFVDLALVLGATAVLTSVPVGAYWLAQHRVMPDLGWTVWVVWLLVAFALTYRAYLASPLV